MRLSKPLVLVVAFAVSRDFALPREQTTSPRYEINHDAGRVTRRHADGKTAWSTLLAGRLGTVRPPDLVWDARRTYVTHGDGVTALDAGTGKVLWHAKGAGNTLLLSGELLLATGWEPAGDSYLTVRLAATGAEVFKTLIRRRGFDPQPLLEVAGLFLVQTGEAPGGKGDALLIDREGRVRHRFDRQVVAGIRRGEDCLFLTSTDVVCRSPDDKVRWAVPFERHQWLADGGLLELAGGDVLAFRYGRIADSGVDLIRLTTSSGKAVWQARCAGLGVGHSEYEHRVAVVVEGDRVRVISRGSSGTFVELLDLASGRQVKRTRSER